MHGYSASNFSLLGSISITPGRNSTRLPGKPRTASAALAVGRRRLRPRLHMYTTVTCSCRRCRRRRLSTDHNRWGGSFSRPNRQRQDDAFATTPLKTLEMSHLYRGSTAHLPTWTVPNPIQHHRTHVPFGASQDSSTAADLPSWAEAVEHPPEPQRSWHRNTKEKQHCRKGQLS